jgi:uncharacterized OB-fold protein
MVETTPAQKPLPVPDVASLPFWEAAKQRKLVVQHCDACDAYQYPPDLICRHCQSDRLSFVEVAGKGSIYTFAVYTRSFMAGFEAPYVLALIDLADPPGIRMMTNILETPIESITVGMPVEVTFEERGGWVVPQFRAVRP